MIRYRYYQGLQPPAPFVNVTIRNIATRAEIRDTPGQVDTAADRTVIPQRFVTALSLGEVRLIPFEALGGVSHTLPSYLLELSLHDLPARIFEVVASAGENWILLGRDVLNVHRFLLDGPGLGVEIS